MYINPEFFCGAMASLIAMHPDLQPPMRWCLPGLTGRRIVALERFTTTATA
jgi:hypothetical protein